MNFIFTVHAQKQLTKRKLPLYLVQMVLEHPQQIIEDNETKIYQSQFDRNGKIYLLRVVVQETVEPLVVVTLYETSKIDKYWRKR